MANRCDTNLKYSKDDYLNLALTYELEGEEGLRAELIELYGEDNPVVNAVIEAVQQGTYNENWDFSPVGNTSPEETPILFNGAKKAEAVEDSLDKFYYKRENGYAERSQAETLFAEEILSRTLYNKATRVFKRPSTESVNKALYQYKLELLRSLWNATGKSHEEELVLDSDASFNRVLQTTFLEFGNIADQQSASVYNNYVILKDFNNLIRKFVPFIKIDAAYENTSEHGRNMYIWSPSGKYRSNWTDSEETDINNVTSPVIKTLLDNLPRVNSSGENMMMPIGIKMYDSVMTSILIWTHQNRGEYADVQEVCRDIQKNGLLANYDKMMQAYIKHHTSTNASGGTYSTISREQQEVIRGIRNHILNNRDLPSPLKMSLINQAFVQAKYSYFSYRMQDGELKGQYLEDGFVNRQQQNLLNAVSATNRLLLSDANITRRSNQKSMFDRLCDSIGVTVDIDGDYNIVISLDPKVYGTAAQITVSKNSDEKSNLKISDNLGSATLNETAVINLIERTLEIHIPNDYKTIIDSITSDRSDPPTLYQIFRNPIAILLASSHPEQNSTGIFKFNNRGKLMTYAYSSFFNGAARFIGVDKGVNELSTLVNGEGNKLPIYQLAPAIFDLFDLIDYYDTFKGDVDGALTSLITKKMLIGVKTLDNVFEKNPYILTPNLLRRIVVRSDIKINNRVKSSDKLSVAEVANCAIFTDFFANLHYQPNINESGRQTNRELEGCILMQPITFSDKKTHFLLAINLATVAINPIINGQQTKIQSLEALRALTDPNLNINTKNAYIKAFREVSREYIKDKVTRQLFNQYIRFRNVFSIEANKKYAPVEWLAGSNITKFDPIQAFNEINEILGKINADAINRNINPLKLIRKLFSNVAALNEDFDFRTVKQKQQNGDSIKVLQANETVFFNLMTTLDDNIFKTSRDRDIKLFASSLGEHGVFADLVKNPELATYFNGMSEANKEKWLDPVANIMKSFIAYRDGKEVTFTQAEIEDGILLNPEVTIELNPIIEAYFWAHNTYVVPSNDLIFGDQANYTPKVGYVLDFHNIDPMDTHIQEMMASGLAMEFKRTTYAGAVKRRPAQGLTFGVDEYVRWAGIDTTKRNISTIRGETHEAKTQDGNGWVDPMFARMWQKSLLESPVGDVRKTIGGCVDPQTGCQMHFKWAEDTITTSLRQRSDGYGSLEMMLKKGRSFDISEKFTKEKIKTLKRYYNPNAVNAEIYIGDNEEIVTHTNYIYQYDIDNGVYYRIDGIEIDDKNRVVVTRTQVNAKGVPEMETEVTDPIKIKNLYDLDQAFGGAWVYDLIDGNMVPSEAVNDIMFHLVCENGMKTDFIGYFVGAEGNKAGHFNFNSYNILDPNNKDQMTHYAIRTAGFGVLQNSDHELDFSNVTEMTQMITLLSQNGRNVELVNQMYEDIGRVANEALKGIIKNLDNESEIYRVLGKALVETFSSGNREELGLAQSFIRAAQKSLEQGSNANDIILPYSAETIKGSFIATVISMINRKGIRRKYAGFGGVEVGAEDIMVHWDVNGKFMIYRDVRDYYRKLLKDNNITWQQLSSNVIIDGKVNPSLRQVTQGEINFGDTIVYKKIGDDWNNNNFRTLKIDTGPEFDLVSALLDPNKYEFYLWEAKSKQLGQSDLKITSNHRTFSEYNTDYVRAIFYLDDLVASRKNGAWTSANLDEQELIDRKKRVLRAAITDSDMSVIAGWSFDNLINTTLFDHLIPQIKKMLQRKNSIYMNQLSKIQKSGQNGTLDTQMVEVNDNLDTEFEYNAVWNGGEQTGTVYTGLLNNTSIIDHHLQKRVAQAAMGRKNFEKFLLKKGDRLFEIKERGANFFFERLKEKAEKFNLVKDQIKNDLRYDALIQLTNDETMVVCVGDPKSGKLYAGQDFVMSSDAISYKGKTVVDNRLLDDTGTVSEIVTKSYLNPETNEIMPVLIVKDFNTLDRITRSSVAKQHIYRYTKRNWKEIFALKDQSLNVRDANSPTGFTQITKENIDTIEDPDTIGWMISTLNHIEMRYNEDRLMEKAKVLYRNFIAQLSYIQTRIPSQAMQSTMEIEIVDVVDIDTNYLWVPLMTHLFQGSDLDIDKGYCMGFDVDDYGNIFAESDLIYHSVFDNVDDIILLPTPNRSKVIFKSQYTESNKPYREISASEFLSAVKVLDADNNAKLIDYVKAINSLTNNNELLVIDDFEFVKSAVDNTWFVQDSDKILRFLPRTKDLIEQAIKYTNIHNASKYDERRAAGALRNKVLVAARTIISDPSSTMDHMMPVSLDEARKAAENSTMGKKEKQLSIYQPMTIFEMQQQNMTGKTVIPLTATGIKSFFIISTGFNTIVRDSEKLLRQIIYGGDINIIGRKIIENLNQLTFDSIFNPNGSDDMILRTFANINFDDFLEQAEKFSYYSQDGIKHNQLNEIELQKPVIKTRANENCWDKYYNGKKFRLYDLVRDLDRVANGNTWQAVKFDKDGNPTDWEYFVVNAADSLGALLNAAADNAKELVLEKLNANQKFADFYVVLLMLGYKFDQIAEKLTSGAFKVVTRYASDNIFDPSTHNFSIENAIDFVLDINDLNNIKKGMFRAYVCDIAQEGVSNGEDSVYKYTGFAGELINKNFVVNINGTLIPILNYLSTRITIDVDKYNEIRRSLSMPEVNPDDKQDYTELFRIMLSSDFNFKKDFTRAILDSLKDNNILVKESDTATVSLGSYLSNLLLKNLELAYNTLKESEQNSGTPVRTDEELDDIPEPDESEIDPMDIPEDVEAWVSPYHDQSFKGPFTSNNLRDLYRYVKMFLIPKNQSWMALDPEEKVQGEQLLRDIKFNILPAVEEIKMVGAYGSINQGLRVGDFEEYNFIERINKFVNTAYVRRSRDTDSQMQDSTGKSFDTYEPFDLLKYLDENEAAYHQRQIEQYDRVKVVVNVLQAIDGIANFREMFKYTRLSRNLISRAAAVRFERDFAKEALLYNQKNEQNGKPNVGLTKSFNYKEFRVLQQYTRDLIILNFFMRYGNQLSIDIPAGQNYYSLTSADKTISPNNTVLKRKTITLDSIVDLANFKHLMDRYIIPMLIQDDDLSKNAFIRALAKNGQLKDDLLGIDLTAYKLNIPLIHLETTREINDYSQVLSAFNKLMYMPVPKKYDLVADSNLSQWTIGDLFFIYNLITYKDRIGGNSMTRLLEDVISSNNKGTLPELYYRYINNLDRGLEDIYNEDGSINPNKFLYNIEDLFVKLAPLFGEDSNKFNIKVVRKGRFIQSVTINGKPLDLIEDPDILSDFTFWMPYALKMDGDNFQAPVTEISALNKTHTYKSSDIDVFDALVNAFEETFGKNLPITVFENKDIDNLFPDYTDEEKNNLANASGFIIDGEIYLNRDKFNISAPLHEIMHFVAAGMKFNSAPEIRNLYYKLLNNVTERFINPETEEDAKLIDIINERYGNRVASDKAEEMLITLLAREFQDRFESSWGESIKTTKQMIQAVVRQVFAQVFQSDKISETWQDIDVSTVNIGDVMTIFAKEILSQDPKLHYGNVKINQEIADLKAFLAENGFIKLENCL